MAVYANFSAQDVCLSGYVCIGGSLSVSASMQMLGMSACFLCFSVCLSFYQSVY